MSKSFQQNRSYLTYILTLLIISLQFTYPLLSATQCKSYIVGVFHVCPVLSDGTLKCWGRNNYGQLGYEDATDRGGGVNEMGNYLSVVDFNGGTILHVEVGAEYTCVLLVDFSARCWGRNDEGFLKSLGINFL